MKILFKTTYFFALVAATLMPRAVSAIPPKTPSPPVPQAADPKMLRQCQLRPLTLLIMLLFLAFPLHLRADQKALPTDFIQLTQNHKFVFVMLTPMSWHGSVRNYQYRKKYPRSGLYTFGATPKLLWRVNWYSDGVIPCSDGHHLIRFGPWPDMRDIDRRQTLALAFYQDGREISQYSVASLVKKTTILPVSISHYQWLKARHLDDKRGLLSVTTFGGWEYQAGSSYLFDVTSGKLASNKSGKATFQKTHGYGTVSHP